MKRGRASRLLFRTKALNSTVSSTMTSGIIFSNAENFETRPWIQRISSNFWFKMCIRISIYLVCICSILSLVKIIQIRMFWGQKILFICINVELSRVLRLLKISLNSFERYLTSCFLKTRLIYVKSLREECVEHNCRMWVSVFFCHSTLKQFIFCLFQSGRA